MLLQEPLGLALSAPKVLHSNGVSVAYSEQPSRRRKAHHADVFVGLLLEHAKFVPENVEKFQLVFEGDNDVDT